MKKYLVTFCFAHSNNSAPIEKVFANKEEMDSWAQEYCAKMTGCIGYTFSETANGVTLIVKTNSGATYRAPASEINVTENGLFGFWDMRLNLIRNPKTYEIIRPADIKAIEYVN